jgi:hypothetical protein
VEHLQRLSEAKQSSAVGRACLAAHSGCVALRGL